MIHLFDHVSAFLIGSAILLSIFAVLLRGQQTALGSAQHAVAKQEVLDVAAMLEQDLHNLGAGMVRPANAVIGLDTADADPDAARTFMFWGRALREQSDSTRICYRWRPSGTEWVQRNDGTADAVGVVNVERLYDANTACSTGTLGGAAILTRFAIHLRDQSDAPTATTAAVRTIRAEGAVRSPVGPSGEDNVTTWSTAVAPFHLNRGG